MLPRLILSLSLPCPQAFRRLGAPVTIVASRLLAKEDEDVRETVRTFFEADGITHVASHAKSIVVQEGGFEVGLLQKGSGREYHLIVSLL